MAMALSIPRYTIRDLQRFPRDGMRYELLEGMLLVTPAPANLHQVVLSRLQFALTAAVGSEAHVVSPGEIVQGDDTCLDPDLLVYPGHYPAGTPWRAIKGWWLAVEVLSRSTQRYDRDFKRAAYLALGVAEVWLVSPRRRQVERWVPGAAKPVVETEQLVWRPPAPGSTVIVSLDAAFGVQ